MKIYLFGLCLVFTCCSTGNEKTYEKTGEDLGLISKSFTKGDWQDFLQNLPTTTGEVVTYRGEPVSNQAKATAIVNYDVGTKDLQQCADALIRLRAEYLFAAGRKREIAFHFTSGDLFSFEEYCNGVRPVPNGNLVRFANISIPSEPTHAAMRRYLDIVYTYAGTISLAKELRLVSDLSVGTVIIQPGSPGHCSIVVDEAITSNGEKVFKLAEGFTPAQSIYILRNPYDEKMGAWQPIVPDGSFQTASYYFSSYKLGVFE